MTWFLCLVSGLERIFGDLGHWLHGMAGELVCWLTTHDKLSGWAQAFAATIAIWAAFTVARLEYVRTERERRFKIIANEDALLNLVAAAQHTLRYGGDGRLREDMRLDLAISTHVYALDVMLQELEGVEADAIVVIGVGGIAFNVRQVLRRQRNEASVFLAHGHGRDDWWRLVHMGFRAAYYLEATRLLAAALKSRSERLVSPFERWKLSLLKQRYGPNRAVEAAAMAARAAQAAEDAEYDGRED